MSKLLIQLQAPPFSINSAYYLKSYNKGAPTKIRTKECREWGDSILIQLQSYLPEIKEFKKNFDDKTDAIQISLVFYIPKPKFYTKAGTIHIQSNDLTNVEKLLVDLLFDARFNSRLVNDITIYNIDINDKLIVDLSSKKRPSNSQYRIEIEISKVSQAFEIASF